MMHTKILEKIIHATDDIVTSILRLVFFKF